jgi:hypothetical protein
MATKTRTAKRRASKRGTRRFLVDAKGRRVAVLLSMKEHEELIEAAEQRDDIQHLNAAKSVKGEPISLDELEARLRVQGKLG